MNLISTISPEEVQFNHAWLNRVKAEIGVDLIGVLAPEFGTRVRLACLLTEAPLQTTKRHDPVDDCTHCLDCVKVCPVGAISSPGPGLRYEVDGMRCKFYRDNVDNCGLCQKACSSATRHAETSGPPLMAYPDSPGVREHRAAAEGRS